jgi:hypothetical protein
LFLQTGTADGLYSVRNEKAAVSGWDDGAPVKKDRLRSATKALPAMTPGNRHPAGWLDDSLD